MVIKANSLNNAATNIWHIAKTKIIKSSENCANGQILQTFIFTFLLGICKLKPVVLYTNSMKKCINIENVGNV